MDKQLNLPETYNIKSTDEIKIGMTFCYTGTPRGTGMYAPEVGTLWKVKTEADIMGLAIEIIERRRGWKPIKQSN